LGIPHSHSKGSVAEAGFASFVATADLLTAVVLDEAAFGFVVETALFAFGLPFGLSFDLLFAVPSSPESADSRLASDDPSLASVESRLAFAAPAELRLAFGESRRPASAEPNLAFAGLGQLASAEPNLACASISVVQTAVAPASAERAAVAPSSAGRAAVAPSSVALASVEPTSEPPFARRAWLLAFVPPGVVHFVAVVELAALVVVGASEAAPIELVVEPSFQNSGGSLQREYIGFVRKDCTQAHIHLDMSHYFDTRRTVEEYSLLLPVAFLQILSGILARFAGALVMSFGVL